MADLQEVLNLYKAPGETPLERIVRFKAENNKYKNTPMTYAGRLDPLADGVLIVLAGEMRYKREEFTNLSKTYEFEVLWGFASDTFDLLGIVKFIAEPGKVENSIPNLILQFQGGLELKYPDFSSKTIKGVPLWKLSREAKLQNTKIPSKKIFISKLEAGETIVCNLEEIIKLAEAKIASVKGDFRQKDAIASWRETKDAAKNMQFPITRFKATVSSGTYIRSIVNEFGRKLGTGALAWKITRCAVENFKIDQAIR